MHSEIIGKDLFRAIKENHGANMNIFISEKVTPVAGDIDLENFGVLNSDLFKEMWEQVDVIVNSAAATNFDERYDMAFSTNTLGAKHVSYFVNQCINIKLLLHVSTAFVSGEQSGVILETPLKMNETLNGKNNLDIKEEMKVIQERRRLLADKKANEEAISADMKEFGIQRAKLHGWPNTYVFTKAMGEMLLFDGLRQDVSLVIVRPTIITSTYKEPFPGWIEGVKTIDGIIATYGRGRVSCLLAELSKVLDVIPADMVINAMIVGMVAHTKQPYSKIIYHVGSSTTNPMKVSSFKNYIFQRYMTVRYIMPLKGVKYINIILFRAFNAWYLDADRKIKIMLRLADLYKPYVLINIIYDDANLKTLHGALRECKKAEKEMFYFDVKSVNWEDYFKNIHIPGLVKYALRVEGKGPKHGSVDLETSSLYLEDGTGKMQSQVLSDSSL
ncbi:alcohol-forming fatty acyl-CoA reductase [Artemisia annua]|uniref:Fatty acyl-CoA reductase n=1 Tax=Artemisia annua TaxID=35608 RepID=A0A2U1M6D9_ARTAN|nr:alcohol-forming fatty acyl-CoA reductase [Artemisia annua]